MMSKFLSRRAKLVALLAPTLFLVALLPLSAAASRLVQREHLTPQEVEQVRENQELSKRTEVFIKAAERRLLALTDQPAASKQAQKDAETWGNLVESTRAQLFSDLAKILDEAVTNIDDTALKTLNNSLLTKSLHKLSDASARFIPQLTAMRDGVRDENERNMLERAIENAEEIIAAANKHPVEVEDKSKKAKGKS